MLKFQRFFAPECTNSDDLMDGLLVRNPVSTDDFLAEILPLCSQNFDGSTVLDQLKKFDPEITEHICSELLNDEMNVHDFM